MKIQQRRRHPIQILSFHIIQLSLNSNIDFILQQTVSVITMVDVEECFSVVIFRCVVRVSRMCRALNNRANAELWRRFCSQSFSIGRILILHHVRPCVLSRWFRFQWLASALHPMIALVIRIAAVCLVGSAVSLSELTNIPRCCSCV